MSVSEQIEIPVPTSEEHRKEIFNALKEMSNAMTRIDAENDFIKDTKKAIKENFGIDTKWLTKALKDYHSDRFDVSVKEFEEYESFYESVVNMKNNSTAAIND